MKLKEQLPVKKFILLDICLGPRNKEIVLLNNLFSLEMYLFVIVRSLFKLLPFGFTDDFLDL